MRGGKGGGFKVLYDFELLVLGVLGVGVFDGDFDLVFGGIWIVFILLFGNRGRFFRLGVLGGMGGVLLDL